MIGKIELDHMDPAEKSLNMTSSKRVAFIEWLSVHDDE